MSDTFTDDCYYCEELTDCITGVDGESICSCCNEAFDAGMAYAKEQIRKQSMISIHNFIKAVKEQE